MPARPSNPALNPENIGCYPLRPFAAWKAFRGLIADKEDTVQVFRFVRALAGRAMLNGYLKLLGTPEGGRQAFLGDELADKLQDGEWMAQFPAGSVGARYREFIAPRQLSAYGLADESRKLGEPDLDSAHPIAWFARRQRDVHDLWHVLNGYGTDALGEVCNLAFTYAQTDNRAIGILAAAAAFEIQRSSWKIPYLRAAWQGYQTGKKAMWLSALDYDKLLAEPLESARGKLNIRRPTIYESIPLSARNGYNAETPATLETFGGWPSEA